MVRAEGQARIRQSQDSQPEISRREHQLQRFGEACVATFNEARVAEVAAQTEMMADRQWLAARGLHSWVFMHVCVRH